MSGDDLVVTPADPSSLQDWASAAGMTNIPVLDAYDFAIWGLFEADFGTPSIVHIGPNMEILSFDEDVRDPSSFIGLE